MEAFWGRTRTLAETHTLTHARKRLRQLKRFFTSSNYTHPLLLSLQLLGREELRFFLFVFGLFFFIIFFCHIIISDEYRFSEGLWHQWACHWQLHSTCLTPRVRAETISSQSITFHSIKENMYLAKAGMYGALCTLWYTVPNCKRRRNDSFLYWEEMSVFAPCAQVLINFHSSLRFPVYMKRGSTWYGKIRYRYSTLNHICNSN